MRYLAIVITFILLVLSPKGIAAQAPSTSPHPINIKTTVEERIEQNEERRAEIQLKIDEKKATQEAKREELKVKLEEKRQERIRILFGKLTTRIESAIDRLNTLIERMETRLAIFAEEGESVAEIQAEIDSVKGLLTSAEASLATAQNNLEDILTSEDPRAGYLYIKDVVKDVKATLTDVHSILVQVIGDMKGLRVGTTKEL